MGMGPGFVFGAAWPPAISHTHINRYEGTGSIMPNQIDTEFRVHAVKSIFSFLLVVTFVESRIKLISLSITGAWPPPIL